MSFTVQVSVMLLLVEETMALIYGEEMPISGRIEKLLLQPFRDLEPGAANPRQAPASTLGQKRTHV